MKQINPTPFLFQIGLALLLIFGNWLQMEELANIAFGIIWGLIFLLICSVLIGFEDRTVKKPNFRFWSLVTTNVILMLAAGWFVTGFTILFFGAFYLAQIFVQLTEQELKHNTKNSKTEQEHE